MSTVLSDEQVRANIAANVTRLRGDRSRYWLAQQVEAYPIAITRIERGETLPTSGLLVRLAEALCVSVDALVSPDAEKFSKNSA